MKIQCSICNLKGHNEEHCPDASGASEGDSESHSESELSGSDVNVEDEDISSNSELIIDEESQPDGGVKKAKPSLVSLLCHDNLLWTIRTLIPMWGPGLKGLIRRQMNPVADITASKVT